MPGPVLLSDIGNVLTFFDFNIAAQRVAELCPFPAEAMWGKLDHIKGPFEDGRMDDATFIKEAMAALEFRGTEEQFAAIWCEIFIQNEAMKGSLAPLVGRVPMKLLSNTNGLHKDYLLSTFDIFHAFDGGVYSHEARCSKPGKDIFQISIQQLNLDPELTFYIDDLEPNIATARELGFETHLYHHERHDHLQSELTAWAQKHRLLG